MLTHHRLNIRLIALCILCISCSDTAPIPTVPTVVADIATPAPTYPKRSAPYLGLIDHSLSNASWFAALIDTESRYNQFAVSPRGALGLTQIMPSNHEWLENSICRSLGKAKPEDPAWQVTCGQMLFEWGAKWGKSQALPTYCGNQFYKSMLFNGGYWIAWSLQYGDGTLLTAESLCGTLLPNGKKRSKASCKENYEYPHKIAKSQQLYKGLGGTQCLTSSS